MSPGGSATRSLAPRRTPLRRQPTQAPTSSGAARACRGAWCCACRSISLPRIAAAAADRSSTDIAQRRRGIEPVAHDAIVVLEHGSALAPGEQGIARAWVLMPHELPRSVTVGSVFTLLEADRLVGRAKILGICSDPTP
ncbi:MAG TPA: hypothetical protein VHY83_01980, partial [Solirubrobacteraceae bacterium]|nr:hypothetical protein [Solirubrobacteraceae bacterium]